MTFRNICLKACALLLLTLISLSCSDHSDKPQSAVDLLKASGQRISETLQTYKGTHGKWPDQLADLVQAGLLPDEKPLLYPAVRKLNTPAQLEAGSGITWQPWIYHRPPAESVDTPLLVAPVAFDEIDGHQMEKAQRLVVKVGTPPQQINDEDLAALTGMLLPQ